MGRVWGLEDHNDGERRGYRGQWSKGKMEGIGHMVWKVSGSSYSGYWKDGLLHGEGVYTYGEHSDHPGHSCSGQFRDGAICGKGIYRGKKDEVWVEGKFKNNVFERGKLFTDTISC